MIRIKGKDPNSITGFFRPQILRHHRAQVRAFRHVTTFSPLVQLFRKRPPTTLTIMLRNQQGHINARQVTRSPLLSDNIMPGPVNTIVSTGMEFTHSLVGPLRVNNSPSRRTRQTLMKTRIKLPRAQLLHTINRQFRLTRGLQILARNFLSGYTDSFATDNGDTRRHGIFNSTRRIQ